MKRIGWLLCLMLLVMGGLATSLSAQLAWDPKEFMGIEEIAPGMKGYGKTVFHGTKVETFDVEVVGVLTKLDFGFDMILVKITSGPLVDRKLQTVSGMSGSPIYINNRLIGAYAYGWDFEQEPIAGVTPIAAMLECTQPGAVNPPLVGSLTPKKGIVKIGDKLITRVKVAPTHDDAAQLQAKADPTTMVLSPVATPLFASGLPDAALKPMQKIFDRYNMRVLAGPGGGQVEGEAPKLEAGSAVGISLMEGDANLTAVGTVTYVKGDTVLAFGHPFFGLGKVNMPMSVAYVHGIINSAVSSFKMAGPIARVGTAVSDRNFAVAGITGQKPDTIPVYLYLTDPERNFTRRYLVDMMNNYNFTPVLLYLYTLYNGTMQMGDLFSDEGTFTARTVISTDKMGDIEQNMVVSPQAGVMGLPMGDFLFLSDALMLNPYEPVKLNKVFIDMRHTPERNIASIEKVTPDRSVVRPGETVTLTVKIRPYGKPMENRTVTVNVPKHVVEPAMVVVVAGGVVAPMLKSLVSPFPATEEGVGGLVRWFTDNPSAQSILTAQVFPSPSYGYRGRMLRDMPTPLLEVLQYSNYAGIMPSSEESSGERRGPLGGEGARPTAYLTSEQVPYVLTGGQVVMIAIETDERAVQSRRGEFDFGLNIPVLSSSVIGTESASGGYDGGREGKNDYSAYAPWFTPQQRQQHQLLLSGLALPTPTNRTLPLPSLRLPAGFGDARPLSLTTPARQRVGDEVVVEAKPTSGSGEKSGASNAKKNTNDDEEEVSDEDGGDEESGDSESADTTERGLLTRKQYSWGLTDRQSFLRGKHLGTGVTSRGSLVLTPNVRSIYQTTDLIPWKMVATANGTYLGGWDSPKVMRLTTDGKSEVFFPKQEAHAGKAEAVTGMAADANGNILIGTWPDQKVRLIAPDGSITREWTLPASSVWNLAITTDGRRFAACDQGTLYLLKDSTEIPLQVACNVPDKHVYALAAGPEGVLYLATMPRGKVYRLRANGTLDAVYEARGAVSSLAVDRQGYLYVGTSPTCRIFRVDPDGSQREIMRGLGRGNHHVLAMVIDGDDLYAATGPAGGIYRINKPAGDEPEVTTIFAREDLRTGTEENGPIGPESLMVNALALAPQHTLLAATSSPGQVLMLEPRLQGAFLSAVLATPAVSRWGQLEVHAKIADDQSVVVETRSGQTAIPDDTWSTWAEIGRNGSAQMSPPGTYAQIRVRLVGTAATTPSLEYARLHFQPTNQPPAVKIESPKAGANWSGVKEIRWEGRDPDEDELIYTVYTSRDDGKTWTQLTRVARDSDESAKDAKAGKSGDNENKDAEPAKDETPKRKAKASDSEINEKSIPWDSKSTPDGNYRVKVVVSDKYAKPEDPKSAEAISGRFLVDNTEPTISLNDKVTGWDNVSRFTVIDNLTPIVGGKYRIGDGPWTALVAEDGIFNSTKEIVKLVNVDGTQELAPGEYKIAIQVKDSAGNTLDRTITLTIAKKPAPPVAAVTVPPVAAGESKDLAELMFYALQ